MIAVDRTFTVRPLHPSSALVLAAADWVGLLLNIITTMHAYWPVVLSCALSSALSIALIEAKFEHEPLRTGMLKGALLSALIVLPFPLAGSLAAFGLLIWWCVS
jgi:hypothetical protein